MEISTNKNINVLLLNHFQNGGGAAGYLRGKIPGINQYLTTFFSSRSDIERLQRAEFLCELILDLTDFSDIIPIRAEVATLEVKRLISYKKQSDHTAHTLYLFLLGIWAYDNISELKQAINKSIDSNKPVKMFIFQWTFSSLLHDIGYLFYDFEKRINIKSWKVYDKMFDYDSLLQFSGKLSSEGASEFKKLWNSFVKKYGLPNHAEQENSLNLIEMLDNIPWLAELIPNYHSGLQLLNSISGIDLTEFAFKMAKTGYNGEPVIDHGVASGLMLLKYSSIWYWFSNQAAESSPVLYKEMNSMFHYYPQTLMKHVIPACRAVAYHNIPGVTFNLNQDPLLYLEVLCDELQIWDRFLSGSEHIDSWQKINQCMAESIFAEKILGETESPLLHLMLSQDHYPKIHESLEKRVENWSQFIQLSLFK
ncbi:hypothetical protein [Paenibacillus odorifer]|uniref:hypothetical protein n=1 Tax=Paenibacillus odorifer TaxID=189426 RepID=UPI0004F7F635|nr:hypothetical protein [Paenibacillus odorifer]AIQ72999.1 hypothetical protein PODO_06880 [Paenibacillus odorifer]